jgi:predicted S18 family serine protease
MRKSVLFVLVLLFMFLTVITTVSAQKGSISLLAVSENGAIGTVAELDLEIREGTGKVFIETVPLTKIDTQLSTRFAQKIACNFLEKDCSRKDFFYTITSGASIIGGPSAGAAISALTAALLDNKEVDTSVTITGTINAGGIIGTVGSVKEKIKIASLEELQTVLIPVGSRFVEDNETGITLDLYALGEELEIEVHEASTLADALTILTHENYRTDYGEVIVDPVYTDVMRSLALDLCSRSVDLKEKILPTTDSRFVRSLNATLEAKKAFNKGNYYTAASKCFSSNIGYSFFLMNQSNVNGSGLNVSITQLEEAVASTHINIDEKELNTINDLQAYVVVKQRLQEAEEGLTFVREEQFNTSQLEGVKHALAFATERLYTGGAWSSFFGTESLNIKLNEQILERACHQKFTEIQERTQYLQLIANGYFSEREEDLKVILDLREDENYTLCLFMASRFKAELDYALTLVSTDEKQLPVVINQRLLLAEQEIAKQTQKGFFPLLGYSYYAYAQHLKEDQPTLALLFSQYSLELSHIDEYLEGEKRTSFLRWSFERFFSWISLGLIVALFLSFLFGVLSTWYILRGKD